MAEITVPVKLQIQNLQSLVNDLQSKLSNLKVGSTGFKAIQNTITAIRGEIDKLSIQTGKPFIDASQFLKAEHSVEKLEDDIEKVSLVMSRLKFSDLELTNEQKSDIKAFEDQLTSIKDKLKVVKSTAKDEFLNSTMGQNWLKIDETAFSKSLSQITNNIRRAVADQNAELNKLEQTAVDYQHALTENNRIKEFISKNNGDPLSQASLGDMYDKIFMTTAKGQFRYTNNGRNLLADWLEQQLHLDDSVIAQIINKNVSAANVAGKLKEVLQSQMQNNQTIVDSNPNITAQVDAANAKYQELIAILRQVGVSEDAVAQAEAVLRAAFTSTTGEFNAYKEKLVQIAQGNTDVQSTTGMMKSQLESLRTTLQQTNGQFMQMQRTQQSFNQMKMAVVNFMGFNQVLNLTKNAIRNAITHIQELDSVMNKISIVTDMSTGDLWNQVDAYSKMAQTYGVSIKGAYEVSQIYYQQGLETRDVMTLTNETLKLAKISGLDYATTTDYMTTALRGFKMEMSEAATVVDVYSNLAAHTAVSQEELAVAMSKTASSMESVGASFEESSAMIATMVAVTRESATNIGSAMKSIASRYGELTKDPTKLVDEEGEAMAFNKVDAALQSVGISMRTVDGQFREFTDVIIELGEKWDQLDSTQQRYIATQFAGNRQQSRFLALVSNVDLLKSNLNYAENAEDTGTLQALKALDSIEAKTEQVRVAYQQFYTTIGAENVWKGFLDGAKNVINTLNSLPKLFGKIPVGAIAAITSIISLIKSLGMDLLNTFAQTFGQSMLQGALQAQGRAQEGAQSLIGIVLNTIKNKRGEFTAAGQESAQAYTEGIQQGNTKITPDQLTGQARNTYNNNQNIINAFKTKTAQFSVTGDALNGAYAILANQMKGLPVEILDKINADESLAKQLLEEYIASLEKANQKLLETGNTAEQSGGKLKNFIANHKNLGQGLQSFGAALNMIAMTINTTAEGGKTLSGTLQLVAGTATMAGIAIKGIQAALKSTEFSVPWLAIVSGAMMLINGISTLIVTQEERIEELTKKAEDLSNKAKEEKANYRTLDNSIKKINELKEKRYESAEAAEEYQTAVDDLAEKFPQMIAGFDEAGNIILDTTDAERILAEARNKSKEATYAAAEAELKKAEEQKDQAKKALEQAQGQLGSQLFASTNDEGYSVERRKYFNTKNYQDANGINRNIKDLITEGDFIGTLYTISSGETERELTANEVVEGVKEFNAALQKIGNQAYSFINEFTGETAEELYTYMQMYKSQHKASELTPEFFEIEQLVNEGLQIQVNAAYQNTVKEINKLKDLDTDNEDFKSQIEIVNNAIHDYQNLVGENSSEFTRFDSVITALSDVNSAMKDYINMTEIYQGNSRAVVSAWQQSATANSQAWDVLSKSSFAATLVTEQIVNEIGDRDYDKLVKNNNETKKWRAYQEKVANFISSMDVDTLEKFNQMGNDTDNYTAEDIIKTFNITDKEIALYIIEHYSKGAESIRSRLRESLSKVSGNTYQQGYGFDKIFKEDFYKQFNAITYKELTSIEEKYLNNILNQYEQLTKEGYVERAKTYGEAALELFEIVNNKYSPEISKQLFQIILEHGLETLEGITNIKDDIRNNPNLKNINLDQYLNIISKNIIPNINLSIETEISNLLETWEDTSKELSKAMSGGLTLKEADALINKSKMLGMKEPININDFVLAGDKLILGYDDFKRYYESLQTSATGSALTLKKHIDAAKKVEISTLQAGYRRTDSKWMEEQRAILEAVGFNWSNAEYWTEGRLNTTGVQAYNDAIAITTEKWNSLNIAAQIAANQLMNAYERNEGIYKLNTNGNELSLTELNNIAKGLDIKGINQLGKDAITERAIKDQLNSVYNTLISDVLSKGFENINLDDYEGLITQNINGKRATGIELGGSYEAFIRKYVEFAGLTIQEANDLIMQAIEKDQNLDIVSDVEQFAKASVGDTLNLTNFYNALVKKSTDTQLKNIIDQFSSMGMTFANGLGKLEKDANIPKIIQEIIRIARDKELLLEEEIAKLGDVLIEFLRALNDIINKGIEGTLSQVEANQLKEFGESQGLNLNFTNTTEGMKLTQASAIELYQAMQKIDQEAGTLASRTTFKNLMDGMIKGNEAYKDASANMARIAELSREIYSADSQVSSARLQEYQAELAVAKEILMTRSTQEDSSFNFMDNKMPGGMYNPINYMQNMAKAFNVIKDSFDPDKNGGHTGMIHAQDWYNIATEMGRIAQITGQEFTMAGVTLDGSMERTSELIQHGFDNLSGVDSGELMVNLPKMGFNFESAAAGLTDAMDDGIKELAKAEIASLDAMIAVLEIMVAMEKLGDVAGEDMEIELGEIVVADSSKSMGYSFTDSFEKYRNWYLAAIDKTSETYNKDLADASDKIKYNGKSMREIMNQNVFEWATGEDSKGQLKFLSAMMRAGQNMGWDLDKIGDSMAEIMMSSGLDNFTVDLGDITYSVEAGKFYQFNWKNENTQNLLTSVQTAFNQDAEQAKATIMKAASDYRKNPVDCGVQTIEYALASQGIIKVDKDGNFTLSDGTHTYKTGEQGYRNQLAKLVLSDLNLGSSPIFIDNNKAVQKIEYGQNLALTARVSIGKDGNISYEYEGTLPNNTKWTSTEKYTNPQEAVKDYLQASFTMDNEGYESFTQYAWAHNVDLHETTKITVDGKSVSDLASSPKIKKVAEELPERLTAALEKDIKTTNENGRTIAHVDLGDGVSVEVDMDDVKVDSPEGKAKIKEATEQFFKESVQGLDPKNIQETAEGVKTALADADVAGAISNAVAEGLQTAINDKEELQVEAPSVKLSTKEVTVDLSKANPEAMGEIKPIEIDAITIMAKSINIEGSSNANVSSDIVQGHVAGVGGTGTNKVDQAKNTLASVVDKTVADILTRDSSNTSKVNNINKDLVDQAVQKAKVEPQTKPLDEIEIEDRASKLLAAAAEQGKGLYDEQQPGQTTLAHPTDLTPTTDAVKESVTVGFSEATDMVLGQYAKGKQEIENALNEAKQKNQALYDENLQKRPLAGATDLGEETTVEVESPSVGAKVTPSSTLYNTAREWYQSPEGLQYMYNHPALFGTASIGGPSGISEKQITDAYNAYLQEQNPLQIKAEVKDVDTKKVDGKESAKLKGVIDESNIEVKEAEDESQLPTTEVKGEFNSEEMQAALSEQTYTASVTTETTVTPTTPQTQEVTYTADTSELENQDLTLEGELIVNGESAEAEVAALKENAASGETMPIDANTSAGQSKLRAFVGMINSSAGKVKIDADDSLARNVLSQLKTDISNTKGTVKIDAQKSSGGEAKGSVSFAKGSGEALAGGRPTLMGELGPELVVSGGRYFIVGQAGAEMVNLDSDAIVFNHQQTASLLRNGKTSRGVPVTNENKAISWAKGNVNGGPAMASASAALAALKNMRAQWQALLSVSVKDLASQGGGGGGGGGGSDPKAFVKELEKWYNWMQQIAQLEKEITLEQAKREKYQSDMIARGREYYNSQMVTLDKLQQQIAVQKSLNDAQQEYFDQRRKELNQQSAFSALYGFGESGQLYYKKGIYKDGMTAFQWLSDLAGRDAKTGKANYTAKEQYQRLAAAGFDFAMQYDSSGNEIDREQDNWEEQAVQAFWDRIDADKEEMQSLHDTLEEGQKTLLEQAQAQNEILREIEENQINVEKKVLKAVEEIHQRQIDNMKDEKAALEKSTKDLTDGLDKQLKQEQNMYQDQKSADELSKLQRQLGILQRSGGSAVEIANLQNQIQEKQYDSYFNEQEKQIQAIKDASDAELERLDKQIELETELLAYQKEHGLLWAEVNEVLKNNPEDIANWLKENTKEYWGQSVTELAKTMREDLFELQKFKEFQEKVEGGMDALIAAYGVEVKEEAPEVKPVEEDSANQGGKNTSTRGSGGISDEERNKIIKRAMREGQALGAKEAQTQIDNHKKAAQQPEQNVPKYQIYSKTTGQVFTGDVYSEKNTAQNAMRNVSQLLGVDTGANLQLEVREVPKLAVGGYIKQAGIAHVDPNELVLTADQTSFLRNEILGNKPNSLLGMLTDLQSLQRTASNTSTISNNHDASVIIENATVEMQVASIANDYDAQRAGEKALDKMLQIARKSQRQNRIGG